MTPQVDTRRSHGGEEGGGAFNTSNAKTDSKHTDSKHADSKHSRQVEKLESRNVEK